MWGRESEGSGTAKGKRVEVGKLNEFNYRAGSSKKRGRTEGGESSKVSGVVTERRLPVRGKGREGLHAANKTSVVVWPRDEKNKRRSWRKRRG